MANGECMAGGMHAGETAIETGGTCPTELYSFFRRCFVIMVYPFSASFFLQETLRLFCQKVHSDTSYCFH